jgi:hypothetical protein
MGQVLGVAPLSFYDPGRSPKAEEKPSMLKLRILEGRWNSETY